VAVLAMRNFLGVGMPDEDVEITLAVAVTSLAVMVALNVCGGGRLRLFCTLIGILVGYAMATVRTIRSLWLPRSPAGQPAATAGVGAGLRPRPSGAVHHRRGRDRL